MYIELPCNLGSRIKLIDFQGTHDGWLVGVKKGLFCEYEYTIQTDKRDIRRWKSYTTKNVQEGKAKIDTYGIKPISINNPFSFDEELITGYFGLKGKRLRFIAIWYDLIKDEYHYRFMDDVRLKTFVSKEMLGG